MCQGPPHPLQLRLIQAGGIRSLKWIGPAALDYESGPPLDIQIKSEVYSFYSKPLAERYKPLDFSPLLLRRLDTFRARAGK